MGVGGRVQSDSNESASFRSISLSKMSVPPGESAGGTPQALSMTQRHKGQDVSPRFLMREHTRKYKSWMDTLEPVLVKDSQGREVFKLECKSCGKKFTHTNPYQTRQFHRQHCPGLKSDLRKSVVELSGNSVDDGEPSGTALTLQSSKKGALGSNSSMDKFVLHKRDQQLCLSDLTRWMVDTNMSFKSMDHPILKRCLGRLGVHLPGEKAFRTYLLDGLAKEYDQNDKALIDSLRHEGRPLQLATDGYKKKYCENGVPNMCVVLLLPTGGSMFLKMENVEELSKSSDGLYKYHIDLFKDLVGENAVSYTHLTLPTILLV